ncbi:hypothetical protein AB0D32_26905 [Micromonospora sp. NPDC048170]|uniref:hypothetical protein n=1 Tax=Micromonospora sp. NPDC048170 TaxID=3154819 RepID=UPI0033DA016F
MATGDVVITQRADRYHVEIQHSGNGWNHIHGLHWETTRSPAAAHLYADIVERDHPGSRARVIKTQAVKVTKALTGTTKTLDLGTEEMDR